MDFAFGSQVAQGVPATSSSRVAERQASHVHSNSLCEWMPGGGGGGGDGGEWWRDPRRWLAARADEIFPPPHQTRTRTRTRRSPPAAAAKAAFPATRHTVSLLTC